MQRRWPYTTSKPIFSAYLQGYLMTFHQAYGIDYYHKPKSSSISFNNLMPPLMCRHTPTSVDHSTSTTKCHSPQWDATCRCMRKPANAAHGHFIWWTEANIVYNLPSTKQAITWMHAVCGYPVNSMWLKAIKVGNYVGWPTLNECNVQKFYPEATETAKGHLN